MDEHARADAAAAEGSVALTSIPILAGAQADNRRNHVEQWLTNEQHVSTSSMPHPFTW